MTLSVCLMVVVVANNCISIFLNSVHVHFPSCSGIYFLTFLLVHVHVQYVLYMHWQYSTLEYYFHLIDSKFYGAQIWSSYIFNNFL